MDSQTKPLFFDDVYHALREAVRAAGGTKKVGPLLFPDKAVNGSPRAQTHLDDCLNRERREKLNVEQMMVILGLAREAGNHDPMHYICEELGYQKPGPANPETEREQLMREFVEATGLQERLIERMERLTRSPLQAVKS